MFVSKSKYKQLEQDLENWISRYKYIRENWHESIKAYDEMKELRDDLLNKQKNVFTKEEIQTLISLCHPDKHGGKGSANNITAKLLKIRKEMK